MNLTAIGGGIARGRIKGVARRDTLYDLLNGYVTSEGTVACRPGTTRVAQLPAGTKGLTAHEGVLHVFAHEIPEDEIPDGFVLHVIAHPNAVPDDSDFELAKIHFAEPFMGFLYVAAEFGNGDVYHFWLQSLGAWEASRVYRAGDIVEPTTPNGIAYRAVRMGAAYPAWAASVPRAENDRIEPTEYNGYYFQVIDTIGASPASGIVEPTWPTTEGAQISEDTEGVDDAVPTVSYPGVDVPVNTDRYTY